MSKPNPSTTKAAPPVADTLFGERAFHSAKKIREQFELEEQFVAIIEPPVYFKFKAPFKISTETTPLAERFAPHTGVLHVNLSDDTADAFVHIACDPRENRHVYPRLEVSNPYPWITRSVPPDAP